MAAPPFARENQLINKIKEPDSDLAQLVATLKALNGISVNSLKDPTTLGTETSSLKAPNEISVFETSDTENSGADELFIPEKDPKKIADFLKEELGCPELDELYSHLYLVARKAGDHIDPLHEHLLKGRTVCITENPDLHLVWYYKQLYVKPLPKFLLSFDFWEKHLAETTQYSPNSSSIQPDAIRRAALGFVRSYSYLICHESDFLIAKKPTSSQKQYRI
jgi:hypothetical protein